MLAACAHYAPAPLRVEDLAVDRPPAPASPVAFEAAVRFAVLHNPELRALRTRAEAVNLRPPREPVELNAGTDADERASIGLSFDALSLLGLGTRPSELALACAQRNEAVAAHHERAREIAGQIAEVYEVERALLSLTVPKADFDAAAFVRAGLEAPAAEGVRTATEAARSAEKLAREKALAANHRAFCRWLGLALETPVVLSLPQAPWPPVQPATARSVAAARADVATKWAAYEVADAALRRAVAGQYPSLLLQPGLAFDPTQGFGMVALKLPLDAPSAIRSASLSRDAAGDELRAAVIVAIADAAQAKDDAEVALERAKAERAKLDATVGVYKSALARVEVQAGSPMEAVLAVEGVVAATTTYREAMVNEAKARVRAATAAGWPRSAE